MRIIVFAIAMLLLSGCSTITAEPNLTPASDAIRSAATQIAQKYIGMRYEWGGQSWWSDPEGSIDCSGLVVNVYAESVQNEGYKLPFDDSTAKDLAEKYTVKIINPLPGDLIFMGEDKDVTHVAILLSSDIDSLTFIDAYSIDGLVEIRTYAKSNPKILSFGRLLVIGKPSSL